MLYFLWTWFLSWVIGWGGVGLVASVLAWLAWFFLREVPKLNTFLLHGAVIITTITIASTYFFSQGYESGYAAAISHVAAQDEAAIKRVKAGQSEIEACRARGDTWDVTTGRCQW